MKKLNTSRTLAVSESSKSEKDLLLFSVKKSLPMCCFVLHLI